MKTKQFFISLLAISTIGMGMIGMSSCNFGKDKAPSDGLKYTLSEDSTYYIVTGIGTCKDTNIVIPKEHESLPVKEIRNSAFNSCYRLKSVTIPDSVTSIGGSAFSFCYRLKNMTIPDSVTSIGDYVFSSCNSLTSVIIPGSVTSIGDYAFSSCNSLTNITVDENNANYSSLEGNLYNKDQTMLIQYTIGKTDTSFTIPDSVTSIGDYAFYDCYNLTSVKIPNSVTSIDWKAFYRCKNLTSITFEGTMEEWNAIEKGNDWNTFTPATEVVCSDGTVTL